MRYKGKENKINQIVIKNRGYYLLLGYTLLVLGVSAVVMQMVGVQWAFLQFLEWGGHLISFIAKILMVIAGFLIIVFASTNWEYEKRDSEQS